MGSQWWCLSRATLHVDPRRTPSASALRALLSSTCWIPDESYFQTLGAAARAAMSRAAAPTLVEVRPPRAAQPVLRRSPAAAAPVRLLSWRARSGRRRRCKLYHFFLSEQAAPGSPLCTPEPAQASTATSRWPSSQRTRRARRALHAKSRFPASKAAGRLLTAGAPTTAFCRLRSRRSRGFEDVAGAAPAGSRAHGHLYRPRACGQFSPRRDAAGTVR